MAATHRLRRLALLTGAGVVAAGAALLGAAPASAHALLVGSNPADGVRLDQAPRQLRLDFSESVELRRTKVTLTDADGHVIGVTDLRLVRRAAASDSDPATKGAEETELPVSVVAQLPALVPNLYRVAWRTLSSDDLHPTSGVLVFGVQRDVTGAAQALPADPLPPAGEVAARWGGLISVAGAAGAGLVLLLGGAGGTPAGVRRLLARIAVAGGAGGAVLGGALLGLQSLAAGGPGALADLLRTGSYPWGWFLGEACSLGLLVAGLLELRRRPGRRGPLAALAVPLLAGYGLSTVLRGHAVAGGPVRVLTTSVHVVAALLWVGTLVTFVLMSAGPAGRRHLLRGAVLRRFGLVAVSCVAAMTLSGLLLAGWGVASLDAALQSTYGRFLLLKLALAAGCAVAGAFTVLRVHPQWSPAWWRPRRVLGTWRALGAEATLAVLVVAAAAAMASSPPATGPSWRVQASTRIASANVADLVQSLQMSPARPGRNFITIDVFDTRRPAPAPVRQVLLSLRSPDGATSTVPAQRQESTRWLVTTDAITGSGRWTLTVRALRPGMPAATSEFGWSVATPGARLRHATVSSRPLAPVTGAAAAILGGLLAGALGYIGLVRRRRRRDQALVEAAADPGSAGRVSVGVGAGR